MTEPFDPALALKRLREAVCKFLNHSALFVDEVGVVTASGYALDELWAAFSAAFPPEDGP